ncbi:Caleosin [Klebsormidium nitens]|uniref:Caleosin n=1 Tax=Klebsormidium nitens TaxID=105231 RepID=A0A1Y1ILK1_KLENI|nr:Caleosin [Klebsormidium nitens]|eukprot:GAQ89646.1 Caleosin [Klebsormidium nitens]
MATAFSAPTLGSSKLASLNAHAALGESSQRVSSSRPDCAPLSSARHRSLPKKNNASTCRQLAVTCKASTSPQKSTSKGIANATTALEDTSAPPKKAESESGIVTSLPEAPFTQKYAVPEDLDKVIPKPWLPRANNTPTLDYPSGLAESDQMKKFLNGEGRTVLQQHVDFFDTDEDGLIYPWDTFHGFRRLGYNPLICALAGLFINSAMAFPTAPGILDIRLPIYTQRIHRAKHGSDSEVYDTEGRFVPQKFEEIFTKFDRDGKGALTWDELQGMVAHNRNLYDFFGRTASTLEWAVTWLLAKEVAPDGREVMTREAIRGQYDGSLFYRKAAEIELAKKKKQTKRGDFEQTLPR